MKWIFLRGLVREQRHWGSFCAQFGEELGLRSEDILLLDLPGIGTERARDYPSSIEEAMEDLRGRALEQLKGEAAAIFSMSLGSMCAMAWAQRHPTEILGTVLINTSAANLSSWRKRLSWQAARAFAQILRVRDSAEREEIVLRLTSNLRQQERELAQEWAGYSISKGELMRLALRQLMTAARFRAPENLSVPALVLSSAADRLVDPSCSAVLAHKFGVENHVHLTAGHDLPLDDPEWVIRKTKAWASGLPRSF